jgi:hypothetical protein
VHLVVAAARSRQAEVKAAASAAAEPVAAAVRAVVARLPLHPDAALDQARLELLAAQGADGEDRGRRLGVAHGLLADHERRFGPSSGARELRGELLGLLARGGGTADDIRRDALALLEAEVAERALAPEQARRLVRAMERANSLNDEVAAHVTRLIEDQAGDETGPWRSVLATLMAHSGDEGALLSLWEGSLLEDPEDAKAAKGLAQRLVRNLRAGLAAPFDNRVLDRVLEAVPLGIIAKWSAEDIDAVLRLTAAAFDTARAAAFLRDRLLAARELKSRGRLWDRALDLYAEIGDEDALLDVAKRAIKHADHPGARLLVAERLLARGESLQEVEGLLRPLLDAKGDLGRRAHQLQQRTAQHPAIRDAHRAALVAFEEQIGVGSGRALKLRVVYTSRSYVLVEATDHRAPDFYEHRHLRTMLRDTELPKGVSPLDLRKGDVVFAPLSGQNADPSRDKGGIRVYWIADAKAVRLEGGADDLDARWDEEEARFGIGAGQPVPIKVRYDARHGQLQARLLSGSGSSEFRAQPEVTLEQLPEGQDPTRLGKGRRFWGLVERTPGGERRYVVTGPLTAAGPEDGGDEAAPGDGRRGKGRGRGGKQRRAEVTPEAAPAEGAPLAAGGPAVVGDAAPAATEAAPAASEAATAPAATEAATTPAVAAPAATEAATEAAAATEAPKTAPTAAATPTPAVAAAAPEAAPPQDAGDQSQAEAT